MAIKGQVVKQQIADKILSTFEGAFVYGKEIRIPVRENGEMVQIKVALTAAKECVGTETSGSTETPVAPAAEVNKDEAKKLVDKYADMLARF